MDEGRYIQNGLEVSFSEFSFLDRHVPSWLPNSKTNENIEPLFLVLRCVTMFLGLAKEALNFILRVPFISISRTIPDPPKKNEEFLFFWVCLILC